MNDVYEIIDPANVKRSAAWLDANYPGWREHINTATLDMAHPQLCIAGQLGKAGVFTATSGVEGHPTGYGSSLAEIKSTHAEFDGLWSFQVAVRLSFTPPDILLHSIFAAYDELDRAWLAVLATPPEGS